MIVSQADSKMLPLGLRSSGGYYLFAQYYFDYKVLKKQFMFHQALHPNVTWLGSIASGKTFGTMISYCTDCLTLPRFKALSTSITSVQAEIQYQTLLVILQDNKRLEPHIADIKNRPYPTIYFTNGSTWTFRTIGYEAKNIRGLEFDRANLDEAAFETSPETVPTLRGRLRGNRLPERDGQPSVPRMARLDLTSSPAATAWFKDVWRRGEAGNPEYDPKHYLSLRSVIWENTSLHAEQIELMKAGMTDEQIRVELNAEFPDYGDSVFPLRSIEACQSIMLNDRIEEAINPVSEAGLVLPAKPGYRQDAHPRYGITHYEVPSIAGHRYIMAGDPGAGDVPRRNAAVVACFDTSVYPYELVYFDWISGHGKYQPFIQSFKYCMELYSPLFKGIDATGPGMALDQLAFEEVGIATDALNFAKDKQGMLNALSIAITGQQFRFPFIAGLFRQMAEYKLDDKKLTQDIVMTLAQIAYLARLIDKPSMDRRTNAVPVIRIGMRGVGRQANERRR